MYRTTKKKVAKRLAVSAVATVAAISGGAALASASTLHPHASTTLTPSAGTQSHDAGQSQNATFGTVTALSANSITITNLSGDASTYAIDASTTYQKDDATATAADVTVGSMVRIELASSTSTTASVIEVETRAMPAAGPNNNNETRGVVTAISASSVTITNPAGTSTSYAITSATTFQKDGATATASDITVGSNVEIQVSTSSATTASVIELDIHGAPTGAPVGGPSCDGIGGTVTAVTPTSVTVSSPSGTSTTYTLTSATTFSENRASVAASALIVGDNVRVQTATSDATLATNVDIELANVVGTVSAINGNVITVQGRNGVDETVTVSSSTTYTKSGAASTLASVSVGSVIFAEGIVNATHTALNASQVGIGQPTQGSNSAGPDFGGHAASPLGGGQH